MTMGKVRLEAFSDGVLAIIITIMVLEMKVPHGTGFVALQPLIPVFLSYVLSFVYIGIYWNNLHSIAKRRDGRKPFCALAGGAVWTGIAVCGNRLFHPHENTHPPAWKRLNSGNIDRRRREGQNVSCGVRGGDSTFVSAALDRLCPLYSRRNHVAGARPPN